MATVLVAAGLAAAGCHDEDRLRERLDGPPARLPLQPDQPAVPPAPALLDTVLPWRQPPRYGPQVTRTWTIVTADVTDTTDLTYRVPLRWRTGDEGDGAAWNRLRQIESEARLTPLRDTSISLASYAAQLSEGNPIYQFSTTDGHVVYLTRREVALAPTEPDAPREVFHTAVVSIDGRICKLDVRYSAEDDWRFDELAAGITGTLEVRPST